MTEAFITEELIQAVTSQARKLLGSKVSKEFLKNKKFQNFEGVIIYVSTDTDTEEYKHLPLKEQFSIGVLYTDGSIECMHQCDHFKMPEKGDEQKDLKILKQLSKFIMIAEFLLFHINCFFAAVDKAIEFLLSFKVEDIRTACSLRQMRFSKKDSKSKLLNAFLVSLKEDGESEEWILQPRSIVIVSAYVIYYTEMSFLLLFRQRTRIK